MTPEQLLEHFRMTLLSAKAVDAKTVSVPVDQLDKLFKLAEKSSNQL